MLGLTLLQLSVKKRGFKVETLDSVFSVSISVPIGRAVLPSRFNFGSLRLKACYDPAQFFDRELYSGAFIPVLLAALAWYDNHGIPTLQIHSRLTSVTPEGSSHSVLLPLRQP